MLDRLIAAPRLVEVDHVDVAAPPARVWERVRHGDLGASPLVRALFAVRALPDRLAGRAAPPPGLRLDALVSTPAHPGFAILGDDPPHEVALGAIGQVWLPEIPFVHVADAAAFAAFATPGYARVAWALRVSAHGARDARVEVEVRVDATSEEAWADFRRYFRVIGLGSRFIRHHVLAGLAREFGAPAALENTRALDGDDLLPDAQAQDTRAIDIAAAPEAIWPWLLQMGRGRAGFYGIDLLDNENLASARTLHPELAALRVGDVIPAAADSDDGFEVLRLEAPRALVLGGLRDVDAGRQLPFMATRPTRFWQVTWAFVLEPLAASQSTRLHVRARAAFSTDAALRLAWIRPVHQLMETAQLRHLAARAEGRLPRDDWRDVVDGVGGAAVMAAAFMTAFLRHARSHWGVEDATAARRFPGDALVPAPRWSWTHGIEIAAPAESVWPWVAQIGVGRGGFYSYQWLENLAGCEVDNAERVHPEWQLRHGDALRLHPRTPPLRVVTLVPGSVLVAHGAPDPAAQAGGEPWAAVSWLFLLEPLGVGRCRLISRFRCATSDDLAMRLSLGPTLLEPVGFAMDRRMLLGIKARAEHVARPLHRNSV